MDINVLATIFKFILFVVEIYYFGMIIYFFTFGNEVLIETKIGYFLAKIYEPFLQPFRKVIPPYRNYRHIINRCNFRFSIIPKRVTPNL